MKKILLAFFVSLTFFACNGQQSSETDTIPRTTLDPPTEFDKSSDALVMDDTVKAFYGDTLADAMITADSIEVYWLDPSSRDTSSLGFYNYKVIEKLDSMSLAQADSLKTILGSEQSYIFEDYAKLCRFKPVLAFHFVNQDISIFVQHDCSLIGLGQNDVIVKKEDINPSYQKWLDLHKELFAEFIMPE